MVAQTRTSATHLTPDRDRHQTRPMSNLRPLDLSRRLIDAYNRRDLEGLIALLAHSFEYVRPGPAVMKSVEEVRRQYLLDWATFDESIAEVRRSYELGAVVAAELTFHLSRGDQTYTIEAAVLHEWRDQRLVRYRAYLDGLPA